MPDAHAAAVEAMAGALEWQRPMRFEQMARVALAALATSEAVRAALVEAPCVHSRTYTEGGPFQKRDGSWVDSWTDNGCTGRDESHPECLLAAIAREFGGQK